MDIRRMIRDAREGFIADYEIDRADRNKNFYEIRDRQNKNPNAPKITAMLGTHPAQYRMAELTGKIDPHTKEVLRANKMDLRGSRSHKVGQILGSMAADITQDNTRSIYWLLNAAQATGEVINEATLAKVNPALYGRTDVTSNLTKSMVDGKKVPTTLKLGNKAHEEEMLKRGMIRPNDLGGYTAQPGFSIKRTDDGSILQSDNYRGGRIQSLAIPTGIAINSGLGLLTPFGGYEGYKAVMEDPNDPSKTSNVVGEVAMKYIVGRTGNLLPYEEFSEVRPDVSRGEYNKYQAFKYDKSEDYNPTDGDLSIGAGTLKYTNEGIHGPEVQMLGRSLPLTTAAIPFAASLAGGAIGARMGEKQRYTDKHGIDRGKGVRGGLVGGMLGLAAGMAGGHTIEGERRRRNGAANGELPMG